MKTVKFGFWAAAGFAAFAIVASIIMGISLMAVGKR
jgi:hypothetical protein